jgi:hypothetical protein
MIIVLSRDQAHATAHVYVQYISIQYTVRKIHKGRPGTASSHVCIRVQRVMI